MNAHSAYSRPDDLFTGLTPPSADSRPGTVGPGRSGLSAAPLPIGHHYIDSASAQHGLGFHPASVKLARDFTDTVLSGWGLGDVALDARLVVSELVTNACRHAVPTVGGSLAQWSIQYAMARDDAHVTCMVLDPSRLPPVLGDPGQDAEGGRGLPLIDSFSSGWGWDILDGRGKIVWAAFTVA
ncbi:anti-sigma regulatory factor (Ser/Thr protein kinase) [Nocardiopsis mwathae]|uniref:Anti-sigma regulatory factor (Ser/Thr protein kinase) n=1 Tax=Nocardiopsis mwathae TaxID=1472723 RepID=A0A7X0D5B8_9ACTN|nr:ATP-binding protein [Nocardiopsis mwathae]MBB6170974.1 anti-sigma regulatory factor (Ser/Thr protein kinase) [Nocardiopsis mwathae]